MARTIVGGDGTQEPCATARLSVTFALVIGSTVLGIAGAVRAGALGRVIDALSLIDRAIPNFFLGLISRFPDTCRCLRSLVTPQSRSERWVMPRSVV